jgi:hypothetical protein
MTFVNKEQRKKYYNKTSWAVNSMNRYTEQELLLIWQHNITDTKLSKQIGRSVQSIQLQRTRMKTGIRKVSFLNII